MKIINIQSVCSFNKILETVVSKGDDSDRSFFVVSNGCVLNLYDSLLKVDSECVGESCNLFLDGGDGDCYKDVLSDLIRVFARDLLASDLDIPGYQDLLLACQWWHLCFGCDNGFLNKCPNWDYLSKISKVLSCDSFTGQFSICLANFRGYFGKFTLPAVILCGSKLDLVAIMNALPVSVLQHCTFVLYGLGSSLALAECISDNIIDRDCNALPVNDLKSFLSARFGNELCIDYQSITSDVLGKMMNEHRKPYVLVSSYASEVDGIRNVCEGILNSYNNPTTGLSSLVCDANKKKGGVMGSGCMDVAVVCNDYKLAQMFIDTADAFGLRVENRYGDDLHSDSSLYNKLCALVDLLLLPTTGDWMTLCFDLYKSVLVSCGIDCGDSLAVYGRLIHRYRELSALSVINILERNIGVDDAFVRFALFVLNLFPNRSGFLPSLPSVSEFFDQLSSCFSYTGSVTLSNERNELGGTFALFSDDEIRFLHELCLFLNSISIPIISIDFVKQLICDAVRLFAKTRLNKPISSGDVSNVYAANVPCSSNDLDMGAGVRVCLCKHFDPVVLCADTVYVLGFDEFRYSHFSRDGEFLRFRVPCDADQDICRFESFNKLSSLEYWRMVLCNTDTLNFIVMDNDVMGLGNESNTHRTISYLESLGIDGLIEFRNCSELAAVGGTVDKNKLSHSDDCSLVSAAYSASNNVLNRGTKDACCSVLIDSSLGEKDDVIDKGRIDCDVGKLKNWEELYCGNNVGCASANCFDIPISSGDVSNVNDVDVPLISSSIEKIDMLPRKLSPTAIGKLINTPLGFYWQYVWGLRVCDDLSEYRTNPIVASDDEDVNFGNALHMLFEMIVGRFKSGITNADELMDFADYISDIKSRVCVNPVQEYDLCMILPKAVSFILTLANDGYDLYPECSIAVDLVCGVKIECRVDLIAVKGGGAIVIDYKTAGSGFFADEMKGERVQMSCAALCLLDGSNRFNSIVIDEVIDCLYLKFSKVDACYELQESRLSGFGKVSIDSFIKYSRFQLMRVIESYYTVDSDIGYPMGYYYPVIPWYKCKEDVYHAMLVRPLGDII